MRILYLGNNRLGYKVLKWLLEQGEEVVGLVMHPSGERSYGKDMLEVAGLEDSRLFDSSTLKDDAVLDRIKELKADVALSVLFGYLLRPEFLSLFEKGVINLHPAFLPYSRGAYPNVWSIVDKMPAGVTLHYIDEGVDTGDIIAQEEVKIEPVDTGKTLYGKLEDAGLELFKKIWPAIKAGVAEKVVQEKTAGTCHRAADIEVIDFIDLDKQYRAGELIDILRARTYSSYKGAYFMVDGRKVYLEIKLTYEEDL